MSSRRARPGDALAIAFISALIAVLALFAALSGALVLVDRAVTGS